MGRSTRSSARSAARQCEPEELQAIAIARYAVARALREPRSLRGSGCAGRGCRFRGGAGRLDPRRAGGELLGPRPRRRSPRTCPRSATLCSNATIRRSGIAPNGCGRSAGSSRLQQGDRVSALGPGVREAVADEVPQVAAAFADAFVGDPVFRFLRPGRLRPRARRERCSWLSSSCTCFETAALCGRLPSTTARWPRCRLARGGCRGR